jgi:hypothetical protein
VISGLPVEEEAVLADRLAEGDVAFSGQRRPRAGEAEREAKWSYVTERDQDRERGVMPWMGKRQVDRPRCFEVRTTIVRDRQIGMYSLSSQMLSAQRSTFKLQHGFIFLF